MARGAVAQASVVWHDWMSAELPFLASQQPWRRACVVVNGTPKVGGDDVLIGDPLT